MSQLNIRARKPQTIALTIVHTTKAHRLDTLRDDGIHKDDGTCGGGRLPEEQVRQEDGGQNPELLTAESHEGEGELDARH